MNSVSTIWLPSSRDFASLALPRRAGRLEAEVTALRSTTETIATPTFTQPEADLKKVNDSTEPLTRTLQDDVTRLKDKTDSLQISQQSAATAQNDVFATLAQLQSNVRILKEYTGALPSLIVPDFPEILEDFRGERFTVLWRGSRDGFGVGDFHKRCDGHANTLIVILDTDGNIFGGFTPVEWESWILQGGPESEQFPFHAEESTQRPRAEICVEGRKEGLGNLL
jgi:hypothetical protein